MPMWEIRDTTWVDAASAEDALAAVAGQEVPGASVVLTATGNVMLASEAAGAWVRQVRDMADQAEDELAGVLPAGHPLADHDQAVIGDAAPA